MPARLADNSCASVTGTVIRHAAVADADATLEPGGMGWTAMGAQAAARPAHCRAARPEPMRRADALRDTLEDEIMAGQLAAGTRLEEVALANRFGVSRTPIREALLQLAAAGLIETQSRRGAVVARIGPQRLQDMFEVLVELEAMAARLAARRADATVIATMYSDLKTCAEAASLHDCDQYHVADERFHAAICQAARNGILAEQIYALAKRLRGYRRMQLRGRRQIVASLNEHESIMEAIAQGDGEAADAAMRAHVAVQGERFADLLAGLE